MTHCSIVVLAASVGLNTTDASLLISSSYGNPGVKLSTMSIRSYFTVKQRDLSELVTVDSSSVAEAAETEVCTVLFIVILYVI